MPNNLQQLTLLVDVAKLSGEFYFQSLLQAAIAQNIISNAELENIQIQSLQLLALRIKNFCGHDSTSLPVEKAQAILESNDYTIGIYLKSLANVDVTIEEIRKSPITEMFQKGRQIIKTKVQTAKHFYLLTCQSKIQTLNYDYNASIDEGIKAFFATYDPDFAAQEIIPTLDYQPYLPIPDLAGVEYVLHYAERLHLENLFGQHFAPDTIHRCLNSYHDDYQNQPLNIYEHLLACALGCVLTDRPIVDLSLQANDGEKLQQLFS